MNDAVAFSMGDEVACGEGPCGKLRRLVVNPVDRSVTHLVVQPQHPKGLNRLVPVDLVDGASTSLRLRCTMAEFQALETAEETHFLPGATGSWSYEQGDLLSWPYFRLNQEELGMAVMGLGIVGLDSDRSMITHDRVPLGEVEVRRGEHVRATDGEIGKVRGLVVDPKDHHVTHVLLEEGHLWGKKEVAIPMRAVKRVDDVIEVELTKDQVRELPPVSIDELTQSRR